MTSRPCPVFRLEKTKGRSPRIFLASRSITSSDAPTTEPELEDVLRALGASKLDVMRKVGIPRSLPYFFGSLKVAITLAFVGAVVSETVGANRGIDHLMLSAQASFQVPLVFAGLLTLAFLGIVLYAISAAIESRFTGWAFRGQAH